MFRFIRTSAVLAAAVLAVTACGSDEEDAADTTAPAAASSTDAPATTPATTAATTAPAPDSTVVDVTLDTSNQVPDTAGDLPDTFSVEAANGTVTLPEQPTKIVSISPSQTETLFAIGAGDQVIAVDDRSNYPAETEAVKSTLSGYTPNVEAIADYEPDLVVMDDDFNGLIPQLEALDIPVWSGPAATTLDDVYAQIEQLGVLTGHVGEAAEVVANMTTDIEAVLAERGESETPLTYYHELDGTLFSVTSNTFIGQLYSLAGLQNIADEAADEGIEYPQLNAEYIITANPELIFLADVKCCSETAETVAARDGWADIAAVQNGGVIELDDDVASRWGPRVVDLLGAIVDAVNAALSVTTG